MRIRTRGHSGGLRCALPSKKRQGRPTWPGSNGSCAVELVGHQQKPLPEDLCLLGRDSLQSHIVTDLAACRCLDATDIGILQTKSAAFEEDMGEEAFFMASPARDTINGSIRRTGYQYPRSNRQGHNITL